MTETSTESKFGKLAGLGCLFAFALPFAAFGVFAANWVVGDVWAWQDAWDWVETPAALLEADLDRSSSERGASSRATAKYQYTFDGRPYTSERVALHGGSDNIGSYQKRRAAELEKIEQAGGRLTCFVNPNDPSDAMLFRDLRPGLVAFKLLFAVIFGGVGFGLMFGAWYGARVARRESALRQQSPNEPWKWRDDWAAGRIRSSVGHAAAGVGVFAALWNLISWPAFIAALTSDEVSLGPLAVVSLFPLVGIGMGSWAGYLWLARRKWGVSEFEMASVPGVLGGPLAGVIHAPGGLAPESGFQLRLACVRKITRKSGGESSTEEVTVWDEEKSLVRDLTGEGERTLIPVQFIIPYDLPASDDRVTWRLEVRAATPGVDYRADFETPVFQTEASSPDPHAEIGDALADYVEPQDLADAINRIGAVLEDDLPGSRTIHFPAARNRGMAAFLAVFAFVWTCACIGLFLSPAPWFFPWIFSAFGALILWVAVRTCFGSTRLSYDRRGVACTHRLFGLGRRRETPRDAIASIDVAKSGTTYNGRAYQKVELRTSAGARWTLASEIARRQDAELLAADIRRVLGLDDLAADGPRVKLEADLPGEFRAM